MSSTTTSHTSHSIGYPQFNSPNSNNIYILLNNKLLACVLSITLLFSFSLKAQDQADIMIANEYMLNGETDKAIAVYESLLKNPNNEPLIHTNYLNLLLDVGRYQDAERFVERSLQTGDSRVPYVLDLGLVYLESGDLQKADRYFKDAVADMRDDPYRIKSASEYFVANDLLDFAVYSLQEARKSRNGENLFMLELANLYRLQGNKEAMVEEYLNYVTHVRANIEYVKNLLQSLLTKPEELEALETTLYDKVQRNPNSEVYVDLLIWVNMQQKNFYGAFIQSRAYDRRFSDEYPKTLDVARIAANNGDYENADRAYTFVVEEYANTSSYLPARLGQIAAREKRIRNSFPVNKDSVQLLINEYSNFIQEYPNNSTSREAQLNQALLYAYFLDEKEMAQERLQELVDDTRASGNLRSKAKMELADIYLLKEEPWESTLLYSQVEKAMEETPIGYEAKLRNGKLSYYKGDFYLAMEHLDILKEATTREIANDAMEISIRIKENTAFDSTGAALTEYAAIELLLYQNKLDEALERIELLKQGIASSKLTLVDSLTATGTGSVSTRAIMDDLYWLEANLRMRQGQFDQSLVLLQQVIDEYGKDVLADDALFMQGDIQENHLGNEDQAMEIYRNLLNQFPGSVYAAEARKRFRTLRGDFDNLPDQ